MLDRHSLNNGETFQIDTTANSVTLYVAAGSVTVTKSGTTIATLTQDEVYTLPLGTGTYTVTATAESTRVVAFRWFVY